jgi:hypothetical protein
LLENVSGPGVDPFHLQIEMEGLPFHQPHACRINPHFPQVLESFARTVDLKASNQIDLLDDPEPPSED